MKILSAQQIKEWDQFTIQNEPITSLQLMERAAGNCVDWLVNNDWLNHTFHIFCGKGNNGGDGLAIARLLLNKGAIVNTYILEHGHKGSDEFQQNLHALHSFTTSIHFIQSSDFFPLLNASDVVIDALYGIGLNRPIEGTEAQLISYINQTGATVISIDIPSGMFADASSKEQIVVRAQHTLTFQCLKPCFLVDENAEYFGKVHVLDIGLHEDFLKIVPAQYELTDPSIIRSIYKPRNDFAHKGKFGHALLLVGSSGKMGAAVLCAEACLRSGTGLLTCRIPAEARNIMQISVPEAMVDTDPNPDYITTVPGELLRYAAIGIGPGLGLQEPTAALLIQLLKTADQPMVLDADALNILSIKQNLDQIIPSGSILTPHPKELARLFGKSANAFERIKLVSEKAIELNCVIILKGHRTLIAAPDGTLFFNPTGNSGMAKGGSGDALTGILTGLLAQGYDAKEAAVLGVYIHGLAGDMAIQTQSRESLITRDLIQQIGNAFRFISELH